MGATPTRRADAPVPPTRRDHRRPVRAHRRTRHHHLHGERLGGRTRGRHPVGRHRRATPTSRGRPAAGRAAPTPPARTPTRSAPRRTSTTPAARETISRCHRSRSAEAYIGGGVDGLNLACCGARTTTYTDSNGYFKPGLDFCGQRRRPAGTGRRCCSTSPATHNVKMVVVSIGGNDFNFASIVQHVRDRLPRPPRRGAKDYCNDDSSVTANFTAANVAAVSARGSPRRTATSGPR